MADNMVTQISKVATRLVAESQSDGRGSGARGGVPLNGGSNGLGTRASRPRQRPRHSKRLAVALAAALSMLASVLTLVAPTASPAQAQADTHYGEIHIELYNFNNDRNGGVASGGLNKVTNREVPELAALRYRVTPRTGSSYPADGCTDAAIYSQSRGVGESRVEVGAHDGVFVRQPGGSGPDCVYDVEWLPSYHTDTSSWYSCGITRTTITLDTVIDGTIDPDAMKDRIAGSCEKIDVIVPQVTIALPGITLPDRDDTSIEGKTITVGVAPATSPTTGGAPCSSGDFTYTVDSSGVAQPPSSDYILVTQPAGQRTSCTYNLTFPTASNQDGTNPRVRLAKDSSATENRDLSASDTAASAGYERFGLAFDLKFVFRHLSTLQGQSFDVVVTPTGADSAGMHSSCTNRFTVQITWDSSSSTHTGEELGVIDYLRGASGASDVCEYNVAWPAAPSGFERISGADVIHGGFAGLGGADPGEVLQRANHRGNIYESVNVRMYNMNHPDNSLLAHDVTHVPARAVPAGAVLLYSVSQRADEGDLMAGCSVPTKTLYSETTPATNNNTITGIHNASDVGRNFVRRTDAAPADTYCAYEVEFHVSSQTASGVTSWYGPHDKQFGISEDLVISNIDDDAGTSYEKILHFQPEIDLTLPTTVMIPGRPGSSIDGETVVVTYARASGNTVDNCGGVPADGLVLTVDSAGAASLPADSVAALWDQPAGERDPCVYALTFPADNGGKLAKVAGTNEDTETSNAAKGASSAYERVAGTFTLRLEADGLAQGSTYTAMVTADGADAQTGAHAECSDRFPVELRWDSTAMKHTGSQADVIDWPQGADAASDLCAYTIAWPQNLPGFEASSPSPVDTMADGGDATATATYTRLPGTLFGVDIQISVPQYDRAGTSDNNFYHADDATRTFFEVDISRSGGPAAGCSDFQDLEFAIGQTGAVAPVAGAIQLIDVPDGENSGCVYSVTFSDSLGSAAGVDPPWTLGLENPTAARSLSNADAASRMVSVRYLEAASDFTPTVDITLPGLDGAASGESLFVGAAFTVGFAPVANSNTECSDAVSYTYTVQTDGMLMPSPALADLVDVPVGQAARCEYDVTVGPDSVSSASGSPFVWTLDQDSSPAPTAMVNQGSVDVTASYSLDGDTTFAATADVTVPDYNSDDDPASHAFAGAQISVGIARSGGPTSDCSAAATITWTIGADGTLSTSDSLVLVDYPAGETDRCVYALTWSANELGGANALSLHTGATASVSGAARAMAAEYRAPTSSFSPSVSGSVELVDEDADEAHDLSGVTVEVSYAAADGSDSGCSASGSAPAVSETYVVGDDGTLALAQPPAVAQAQTAVSLVDRPTGVNARCVYVLTYPEAVTAAADPEAPAGTEPVSVPLAAGTLSQLTAVDALVLNYATPPTPPTRVRVDPIPLMSANRGVERLPVRVALNVPSGVFAAVDTFEVLVWVPDACGSDTFLFGGVPASAGVAYAASASDTGQVVVVGEGASQLNRRAEYSLPPYVDGAGGREACAVRVSALASPQGCSMVGSAGTDSQGRAYIESVWAQGSAVATAGYDLTASFDCPDLSVGDPTSQASVSLSQGWVTMSFNGPSGTTPREFAQLLDGAVDSMWAWNPVSQSWRGWTQQHGTVGLATLTRGQTVMAYVPAAAEVNYSPDDLLALPAPTGSLSLAPGYNLVTYNGNAPVRLSVLLREPWPINVVFLWHTATQTWRYYLPEIGPIAGLGIDWFSILNPGDTVFLHSQAFGNVTYPWA